MGGKTTSTSEAKIADIKLQTSAYGGVLPLIFGTNRVAGNLIWYGNFTPIPHTTTTSSGGKGLGKTTSKNTTYTYTAAVQLALAQGPIAGVGAVWKGKDKTTLAALGLTLFTGTLGQSPWSFRTGYNGVAANIAAENAYGFAGQAIGFATSTVIGYSGTAYLAASSYDLGSDASVPNHGFEVQGLAIYGGGSGDANPKDVVTPFLTDSTFGAGFNPTLVGDLSSFDAYCRAAGLFFSPAYTAQRAAADCLKELTDAANTALVWSDGVLKFVPYGDMPLSGSGATYTPNTTAVYDLTDDNFLNTGGDPVKVTRTAPADVYNRIQIEYLDRANQYNTAIASVEDQAAIEAYGLRVAPVVQAHFIADGAVATLVAQLLLQSGLYKRNSYAFGLPASFALLEPMDIVTLTSGDMNRLAVRITEIDEDGDDFALTAEDFPLGVASAAQYQHDAGLRYQPNLNTTPLSCAPPIIFELPADPSATGLSVAIAVGGQTSDPLYGGCNVWLSLDGTNYKKEGTIFGSSRYGTTTAPLATAPAGIDTADTLSLALRSNAQMISGSSSDVAKGTTLINVGGEYLAYQTATLTGTNAYNLTTLNRGLYGTTPATHASGVSWVRVDDAVATLKDLDLTLIGQTIHIKVTAFNAYEGGEQDLSTVTAYTYTITGNMKALETPVDFATGVGGAAKPANNADVTATALAAARYTLTAATDRTAAETRARFDPLFWTCNFPNTMIAATRATAVDAVTLDMTFFEAGQLAGLIWESADNYDHPTTAFDTHTDYRGCTLTFRLQLSAGLQALGAVNGPTLTIEGRDASGTATTWYVLLGNTHGATGTPTDANITLNFNSLPGGFDGTGSVYCGDVDRMFISAVPTSYSPGSTTKLATPVAATMILSNMVASGTNATLTCGLGPGGVHEVRMTNGYDDTYNVTPDRIVRNCRLLGYKGEFNHYVGMSHYFQWAWSSTESRYIAQDVSLPLNTPALLWHQNLAASLHGAGMTLILSISYEMLNSFAPTAWRQLDGSGNPSLTGWSPPSTLLSPCNTTAMAYLQRLAVQLASIADAAGLPVAIQVGEPWYWIDFTTYVPFFYDAATTAAYTAATSLTAPAIATMTSAMSAAQLAYLDWLGTKLSASVVALHAAVRTAYPRMTSLVLLYLPQLINSATPETHRVNMPVGLAYPAVDILQLEDYDFVIANRSDLSATARGVAEATLKYPRSRQHYFSGFALYKDTSSNIWTYSSTAMSNAYDWGVFPVFIWAYTQVMRDGFLPRIRAAPALATADLKDVRLAPTAATDAQVLRFNAATGRWLPGDAAPLITAPAVQIPTLTSPWINYGSGFLGARYYKTAEGVVVVEGLIQATTGSPTTGVTLFTLLPGFRPSGTLMFTTANGGGSGRIDVDSGGNVIMQSGNTVFTSLSLSFLAA